MAGNESLLEAIPEEERAALGIAEFFRRLARYFGPHKGKVGLIIVACGFETGFYSIVPLSFRYLIDHAMQAADRGGLIAVLIILGVGSVVASLASLWRGRYWARVESQVVSDIRFQLFHKLQQLSSAAYAKNTTGELLSRFSNDLSAVRHALTMAVIWGALPGLDCILGTVILLILDWRLGLLATVVWPWCLLLPPGIARRAGRVGGAVEEVHRGRGAREGSLRDREGYVRREEPRHGARRECSRHGVRGTRAAHRGGSAGRHGARDRARARRRDAERGTRGGAQGPM